MTSCLTEVPAGSSRVSLVKQTPGFTKRLQHRSCHSSKFAPSRYFAKSCSFSKFHNTFAFRHKQIPSTLQQIPQHVPRFSKIARHDHQANSCPVRWKDTRAGDGGRLKPAIRVELPALYRFRQLEHRFVSCPFEPHPKFVSDGSPGLGRGILKMATNGCLSCSSFPFDLWSGQELSYLTSSSRAIPSFIFLQPQTPDAIS